MRLCILISVVCVLTAFGSARPEPRFDPKQVVRQARTPGALTAPRPCDTDGIGGRQRDRVSSNRTTVGRGRTATADSRLGGGPEFMLDTNSVLIPAPGFQNEPAIAFDSANFLVVWEDHRIGSSASVCGARVTPEGTVLDLSGFVVSQGADDRLSPAVGFDGQNFLVVWQEYDGGSLTYDICGTRVTPGGTVLDPDGIAISEARNDQLYPTLAFDGTGFLVAWQDYRDNRDEPDIYGARVTSAGTVLDPSGFAISQAAFGQFRPALGFGGALPRGVAGLPRQPGSAGDLRRAGDARGCCA